MLAYFIFPDQALAESSFRENVNDWYIKSFTSEIQINNDSTALITERIVADCDKAPNKHGIFRTLPTQVILKSGEKIIYPIKLLSITDFNNKTIKYTQTKNKSDHTITWKIGDPNITVEGINNYQIRYEIKNIFNTSNLDFDELYWNLNGNFWDLEIDQYMANIILPSEINQSNSQINLYSGKYSDKNPGLAQYSWIDQNTIRVISTQTLEKNQGITVSITFAKNIVSAYQLSQSEIDAESDDVLPPALRRYLNKYSFLLIIIALIYVGCIFWLCYYLWSKYGKDPKINPTIVPEFEIPDKLTPMEIGVALKNGSFSNNNISAAIVNLAVKKYILIENITKKGIFKQEDYKFKLLKSDYQNDVKLIESEKLLLSSIFAGKKEEKISNLKNKFYIHIPAISKSVVDKLKDAGLVKTHGILYMGCFLAFGLTGLITGILLIGLIWQFGLSLLLGATVAIVFSFLMPQRTLKGAELARRIQGFKLYMETAEKYRQRFNEKENIFEKLLPYAMIFGITSLWINKIKLIYGSEYFQSYSPYWYTGAALTAFNANTFNSAINNVSSSIASSMASHPSSGSGAGGGGFSGGGGGGGGGGGW